MRLLFLLNKIFFLTHAAVNSVLQSVNEENCPYSQIASYIIQIFSYRHAKLEEFYYQKKLINPCLEIYFCLRKDSVLKVFFSFLLCIWDYM